MLKKKKQVGVVKLPTVAVLHCVENAICSIHFCGAKSCLIERKMYLGYKCHTWKKKKKKKKNHVTKNSFAPEASPCLAKT